MSENQYFEGFSKLSRDEKLKMLAGTVKDPDAFINELNGYRYQDPSLQEKFDQFSENTISNFHLPYGIAPNFLIDGKLYHIPMVTEESSVIAAASKAAKFWYNHGGFQTEETGTAKRGHVHFLWYGESEELESLYSRFEPELKDRLSDVTKNMDARGGGITESWLSNMTSEMDNYYVLGLSLETVDSMGANFINSVLEKTAGELKKFADEHQPGKLEILMAILSNYTPRSYVKMKVECPVEELEGFNGSIKGIQFAEKFSKAVQIAKSNVSRAVTNNKGIMNGVDAVVIATGNDFRAVEAGAHAYSISHGKPSALTDCKIENGLFTFRITLPLAMGTVGGVTRLHPLASRSLEILGNPDAKELMKITAAVGLASNFSATTSLITTGIQKGHMKLHLENILMAFNVDEEMKNKIRAYFKDKEVSYEKVKKFIEGKL